MLRRVEHHHGIQIALLPVLIRSDFQPVFVPVDPREGAPAGFRLWRLGTDGTSNHGARGVAFTERKAQGFVFFFLGATRMHGDTLQCDEGKSIVKDAARVGR